MLRRMKIAAAFPLFVLACACLPAHAGDDDHVEARRLLQQGEILPLAKVLEVVRQHVPGDVIEVELERDDDEDGKPRAVPVWEYEIEVLTASGVVRKVKIDARTGVVLKVKDD